MLLTTGAIALSRKVADERAKRREKKQGKLQVGNTDVAKRAFEAQTSKMIGDGSSTPSSTSTPTMGINRAGTEIKFEDADGVVPSSPDVPSVGVTSPDVEVQDTRSTSQLNVTSPVQSEKAAFGPGSPYAETPTSAVDWRSQSSRPLSSATESMEPPPYSPRSESSRTALSPSVYSRDVDASTLATSDTKSNADTMSIASKSTNSQNGPGIRVKTKGDDLKSGFPYHPALFDLRIHPDQWDSFTYQVTESTKFETKDYARMIGSATGIALTGAIGTSIWFGRSMNRKIQEEKIKNGLLDDSTGLGETLKSWNEDYFSKLGVFVHIELSESAMKNPDQKSKAFRRPAVSYNNREDRARKTEERKFVLVVTKLDEEGVPSDALKSLDGKDGGPVEIGSSGDVSSTIAEAPGDEGFAYVELPAEMPATAKEKKLDPPEGYAEMEGSTYVEMDADNSRMMEKLQLEGDLVEADPDAEKIPAPRPLSFDKGSESLNKEMT